MSEPLGAFRHPWSEGLLGEVATVSVGGTPSTSIGEYWGGDVPWMASGDVHLRRISDVPGRITRLGLRRSNATLLSPPTVAIALAGQGRTRGMVALVLCELSTNQSVALVEGREGRVLTHYLFHNLSFRYEELRSRSSGNGRAGLSKGLLEKVPIPLPPLSEQFKIAEVLSIVDRAIEETERLIVKHRRIKAGLLHGVVTGGIDQDGQLRSEGTHKFKNSPLGRIPDDWEVTQLGAASTLVTSGARGWARYYAQEGPIFIRIGNLTREHINLRLKDVVHVQPPPSAEGRRTLVMPGDLLVSVTADLGIIGVVPDGFGEAYINQHIALVRPDNEKVSSRFLGWFLSSRQGQRQFRRLNESGAKAGLNLPTVRSLLFPRPSSQEQEAIAEIIDSSVAVINMHIRTRQKLMSIRTGLRRDLLTGEKSVTPLLPQPEVPAG
jgi:type I restriction enzyme S subunit